MVSSILFTFADEFRYSLRMLAGRPIYTIGAVTMLALGIGSSSSMYSVVNSVILNPSSCPEPENLYTLRASRLDGGMQGPLLESLLALQQEHHALEELAWYRLRPVTVSTSGGTFNVIGSAVSAETFQTLGVPAEGGRTFTSSDYADKEEATAILSSSLSKRIFPDAKQIVGSELELNGRRHTIIGVMPADFRYPRPDVDVWLPWKVSLEEASLDRTRTHGALARAKPGWDLPELQAEADSVLQSRAAVGPDQTRLVLTPYREFLTGGYAPTLWGLFGAVGLLFLIACFNLSILSFARASQSLTEFAIRSALGCRRRRIIGQVFTESLIIGAVGGLVGILLAFAILRALAVLEPDPQSIPGLGDAGVDGRVLAAALLLSCSSCLLFGLLPAIYSARLGALRATGRSQQSGSLSRRLRYAIVVMEVAMSLVLVISSVQMMRGLASLTATRPGFRAESVLAIEAPAAIHLRSQVQKDGYQRLLKVARSFPGVALAAITTVLPLGSVELEVPVTIEGHLSHSPEGEPLNIPFRAVSQDYFKVLGIPLKSGRHFDERDDTASQGVVIINEAMAQRYWPDADPEGRRITVATLWTGKLLTIVGVVGNVHQRDLQTSPGPEVYVPYQQFLGPALGTVLVVKATSEHPDSLGAALARQIREQLPEQPMGRVRTMEEVISGSISRPRFYVVLLSSFAILALLLAHAGVYGLAAFASAERRHEFGIRIALGATGARIRRLVLVEGMAVVGCGLVLGVLGSIVLLPLLASNFYGIDPYDPGVLGAISFSLFIVGLLAVYAPARRLSERETVALLNPE